MYHFSSEQISELRLSDNVLVTSRITQYLKSFQIEALSFLYDQLSKQELCIYNDESGLGKSATIAALLSAVGPDKKTLIVLQNDDQLLVGWQFHFGVLTELPVCVLQNVKDSTNSAHSVYLAKWSILRGIGDLSKLNFDYVIVDHRGSTLNNNFCTSMLLKQFERKVNIVISSLDITSEVKLLYNVLRMGGRLEHQYKSLKSFERKFYLPDAKEVFSKRMDLEEYYKQRGILGEYIKSYRLRRYRHQYDQCLPLVTPEQYKTNLSLWLASNNNSNSTLSGDTIASSSEVRSTAGTDEIIECLMSIKMERALKQRDESEKMSEHSDELIAMSPLVFEMSDSDAEQAAKLPPVEAAIPVTTQADAQIISSDDCEIVTPPTTPPPALPAKEKEATTQSPKKKYKQQLDTPQTGKQSKPKTACVSPARKIRSCGDLPQVSNKIKNFNIKLNRIHLPSPCKTANSTQATGKAKVMPTTPNSDGETKPAVRSPKSLKRELYGLPSGVHNRETRGMKRLTRSAEARLRNKYMTGDVALQIDKKPRKRKIKSEANQTPVSSRKAQLNTSPSTPAKTQPETPRRSGRKGNPVKKETPKAKANGKTSETPRKNRTRKEPPKPVEATVTTTTAESPKKKSQSKSLVTTKTTAASTSQLISSGSTNSEFAYMQCGQKLPESLTQLDMMPSPAFRMPYLPHSTPFVLPAVLNLCSESEVTIVPASQQHDIVVINSSQDESSEQSVIATQSRRTRALKRNRSQLPKAMPHNSERASTSASSFGQLLAQQRAQNKSPDIFSNCSQISNLTLTQPAPHAGASHFEGFKIFGSEVKQMQQQHANTPAATSKTKRAERSCLDILEQMFEPRQHKTASKCNVLPTLPPSLPNAERKQQPQRRRTLIEDDIFEITNNGEFGSRMRLTSSGDVSPVQQPTQQRATQHNKITNYFLGASSTQEEEQTPTASSRNNLTLRKSPKSIKSTQSTKLTRWFGTAMPASGESVSAPSTPQQPAASANHQAARNARSCGPTKRKRLELFK